MRLRQIALVTPELRSIEHEICDKLGLEVCYRDPGLSHFGLRHGLYAIGDQILEVVAPKQPGTTAERFLERRRGEGGYMVLLQTENIEQHKSRLAEIDIRIVHDGEITEKDASIRGIHLHPKEKFPMNFHQRCLLVHPFLRGLYNSNKDLVHFQLLQFEYKLQHFLECRL